MDDQNIKFTAYGKDAWRDKIKELKQRIENLEGLGVSVELLDGSEPIRYSVPANCIPISIVNTTKVPLTPEEITLYIYSLDGIEKAEEKVFSAETKIKEWDSYLKETEWFQELKGSKQ